MEAEGGWRWTGTQQRKEEAQEEPEQRAAEKLGEEQQHDEEDKEAKDEILQGIASIALFPSGSLSGHFLHTASSTCLGLFGTEIACERECSRGEDYRLMNLTIINYKTKQETTVVVERKGEDAARLSTACDLHGWDEEVVVKANERHRSGEASPVISFECETLKADIEAEEHLKKFLPSLVGRDAVVNIGHMTIKGLSLSVKEITGGNRVKPRVPRGNPKRSLEDTLQLVFGEVDHAGIPAISPLISSDSAQKSHVIPVAEESKELQGLFRSTPTHRAPCDLDDDF